MAISIDEVAKVVTDNINSEITNALSKTDWTTSVYQPNLNVSPELTETSLRDAIENMRDQMQNQRITYGGVRLVVSPAVANEIAYLMNDRSVIKAEFNKKVDNMTKYGIQDESI